MSDTLACIGTAAPYYNLVLVLILVALFIYLFRIKNSSKTYTTPWKLLFAAILIFIVEELMTVLKNLGILNFHYVVFAFFELAMVILFIYMCLLQREKLDDPFEDYKKQKKKLKKFS